MNGSTESDVDYNDEIQEKPDILGRHWVQDLFPPAFGYTLQEIIDGQKLLSEEDKRKKCTEKEESDIFCQLSKVIPPADVAAIKNVYRRVWVMMRMKEKSNGVNKNSELSEAVQKSSDKKESSTNVAKCIWTPSEIDMLRTEFRSTKDANKSLQAEIKVLKEELLRVKAAEKSQRKAIQSQATELHEAQNANMRLQHLCNNLKSEFDRSESIVASLRTANGDMQSDLGQAIKKFERVRKMLSIKQIEHDNLKVLLAEEEKKIDTMKVEFKEKLRRELEEGLKVVNARVNDLSKELENEKGRHRISLRGLEQLRVHFSSTQSLGAQNIVDKDQLGSWTYN